MLNYICKNFKKNMLVRFSYIFTLISMFTIMIFSVTYYELIKSSVKVDEFGRIDEGTEFFLNTIFMGGMIFTILVFIIFHVMNLNVLMNKKDEIKILNRLNIKRKKILWTGLIESVLVGFFSIIISGILNQLFVSFILKKMYLNNQIHIIATQFIVGGICLVIFIFYNYYMFDKKLLGKKNKNFEVKRSDKKEIIMNVTSLVISIVCLTVSFIDKRYDFLFLISIIFIIRPVYILILLILKKICSAGGSVVLFIVSNNLFFYRSKYIITMINLLISASVFLGMFSFFDSIRFSISESMNENIKYDYYAYINPLIHENVQEKLKESGITEYTISEVANADNIYKKAKIFTVNSKERNKDNLLFDTRYIKGNIMTEEEFIIVPQKIYENDSAVNKLKQYVSLEKIYPVKTFDLGRIYASKGVYVKLDKSMKLGSVLFLKNNSKNSIDNLKKITQGIELNSSAKLKKEIEEKIIKGTEQLEFFLYVVVFMTTSMLLNQFILFYGYRKEDYKVMSNLNMSNKNKNSTMFIEVVYMYMYAWIFAVPISYYFGKGALDIMLGNAYFPINYIFPLNRGTTVFLVGFLILIIGMYGLQRIIRDEKRGRSHD